MTVGLPARVTPPTRPLGGLAFLLALVRNPLEVMPRTVYEEDLFAYRGRLWITAPSLVRTVFLEECEKYRKIATIRLLSPLLGNGMLTSEGADWRRQRQASSPIFRSQDILRFVPTFVAAAERLLDGWRATPRGTCQPIDRDMRRVSFEVISKTLLPSADDTVTPILERAMDTFQRWAGWGILYAGTGMPKWVPRPGMRASARAVSMLRAAVQSIVRERSSRYAESDDLLQRLMDSRDAETGRSMDERQLVDSLLTFYLAGHETTARALTWTLYLLARSPEWTAKLKQEIHRVAGGKPIGPHDVDRLLLVQQVLKESMRLYPPVPILGRQAVAETTLGTKRIMPMTTVLVPIYAVHRHLKRWSDPDVFDPNRFSAENESKLERYQYMPFGAGPRVCIGMGFAMSEATAILGTLIQRACFFPGGHEPYPVARVTLFPRGGVPLRVFVD